MLLMLIYVNYPIFIKLRSLKLKIHENFTLIIPHYGFRPFKGIDCNKLVCLTVFFPVARDLMCGLTYYRAVK
jgi:hypothetical protein